MSILQSRESTEKEKWNEFILKNNPFCFLQSWEWGRFQESFGRKIWRVKVSKYEIEKENNKSKKNNFENLIGAALIIKYNMPFENNYLYCPRGPVIYNNNDNKNSEQKSKVIDVLFSKIKEIAKTEKSLFLRIDPSIEDNNKEKIFGAKKAGKLHNCFFIKSQNEIQPRDTLTLDLKKSEGILLREMKPKTRYNIKLAKKLGVKIIKTSDHKKYFPVFWNLMLETSKRNKIAIHDKNYYKSMLECLCCPKNANFEAELRKNKTLAKLYLALYNKEATVANVVLFFGKTAIYLHGASSSKYRNVMSSYLAQWTQILDAKKYGCAEYDFWGISRNFKKKSWRGITKFKKGFGGLEKSYIGSYDIVFNKPKYLMYRFLRKIKSIASFPRNFI